VGTEVKHRLTSLELEPEMVEQQLADNGPALHSLRKETKRVRYQMEVLATSTLNPYIIWPSRNFGSDARQLRLAEFLTDVGLKLNVCFPPWLNNWRRQV